MLKLPTNYSDLDKCEYIICNRDDVINILAQTDQLIYIDTCFLDKIYKKTNMKKFFEYLELVLDETAVIVVTEVLLCEFTRYTSNYVSKEFMKLLKRLNKNHKIVLLKEEWIIYWRRSLVDDDTKTINNYFRDIIKKHKTQLPRIDKYVEDIGAPYNNILFGGESAKDDENFISNIITYIKSKKSDKDSLAELLIFLISLFMIDLYETDLDKYSFIFLTADRKAAARIKDIQRHSEIFAQNFSYQTIAFVASEMIRSKMFDSEIEAKECIRCLFDVSNDEEKVRFMTYRQGYLEIKDNEMSVNDFYCKIESDLQLQIVY